jgi:hypothetical protein
VIEPASVGSRRAALFSDLRTEAAVFKRTWNTWNGSAGVGRWLRALGVGAALAATLPGCMAHARGEVVYDYPVVTVEAAPARIETYPRTYYHGRPAYLVDGRWYYRSGPRWVYFREEPVELRTYRVRHYDSPRYRSAPRSGERYSDVVAKGRAERHRDERRAERYRDERRAAERAEQRRAEQRRAEHRRAEMRREEREQRAADRRREEHRAAERRAAERRLEDRRAEQRRDERKGRVAEKERRPRDDRRRARDRDRDREARDRRND